MPESIRYVDPLIPDPGATTPADRQLRINWVANLQRSPEGAPLLPPEVVVHHGRSVRLIDIRSAEELLGPQGYVAGVDWVPAEDLPGVAAGLPPDGPIVLISRDGKSAAIAARALERLGMRFVAAMSEGMLGWRHLGFATTRKPEILERRGRLRAIERETPDPDNRLTQCEIEQHVGDPFEVRWVRMAGLLMQGRHHCVDGRDDSGVVGTPGGDAGEMLLLLASLEHVMGRHLTSAEVRGLFAHTLDAFGAFYMHTDVDSTDKWIASLRDDRRLDRVLADVHEPLAWRGFFRAPPREVRPIVLEHLLADPAHIGCGHVKLMWTNGAKYDIRPELVRAYLASYFDAKWSGADEIEFVHLAGEHDEAGVLRIHVEGDIFPFTQIPLVSPSCHGSQMFIVHPQVARYYRTQLGEFLCRQRDVLSVSRSLAPALHAEVERIAERQSNETLLRLAGGLPVFDVTFEGDHRVSVRYGGDIPKE